MILGKPRKQDYDNKMIFIARFYINLVGIWNDELNGGHVEGSLNGLFNGLRWSNRPIIMILCPTFLNDTVIINQSS